MLGISRKPITVLEHRWPHYHGVESKTSTTTLRRFIYGLLIFCILVMFLPWTQNIQTRGYLTALVPQQRPQVVQAPIPARIEKWLVKEGDFVHRGDTLLLLSEIKTQYLDANLIQRTQAQLQAKRKALNFYLQKINALDSMLQALNNSMFLKLRQARNKVQQKRFKVQSDSAKVEAAQIAYQIAKAQYERMVKLYEQGLRPLIALEKRRQTMQKAYASLIEARNQLWVSQNELQNAQIELNTIEMDYTTKIAKVQSDKNATLSTLYKTRAEIAKLENVLTNYTIRRQMHAVVAPQDGYVTKALKAGIGEIVKEGEQLLTIVPAKYELAVEMYVKPLDLPLIKKGQKVLIQFDGWPAIVFSGWPNLSYGTYKGVVFAIDRNISPNGKYRVLVAQDPDAYPWPDALRPGSGARNILLLNVVPIWYELWRQFNGFPPDFYKDNPALQKTEKKK